MAPGGGLGWAAVDCGEHSRQLQCPQCALSSELVSIVVVTILSPAPRSVIPNPGRYGVAG
jgi:hypothetical protein